MKRPPNFSTGLPRTTGWYEKREAIGPERPGMAHRVLQEADTGHKAPVVDRHYWGAGVGLLLCAQGVYRGIALDLCHGRASLGYPWNNLRLLSQPVQKRS